MFILDLLRRRLLRRDGEAESRPKESPAMKIEEARRIYKSGEDATIRKLMELDDRVADLEAKLAGQEKPPDDPGSLSTPSGMKPPYRKPPASRRRKKPGREKGHPGVSRAVPIHIDRCVEHRLSECPYCSAHLGEPLSSRRQIVEDIPAVQPVVTENIIYSYDCSNCHHKVEAPMPDALPRAALGLRLTLLSAYLHYGLGMTTRNITAWLRTFCQFQVTPGGLTQHWQRLAQLLTPVYEGLAKAARLSAVLNVDESGWRIRGRTAWLWCFTSASIVYFVLTPSRASPVIRKVLGTYFRGILVADFFGAYNRIRALAKQRCIVHLLRELKTVSLRNRSPEWRSFARRVKRLIHEAMALAAARTTLDETAYQNRVANLHIRLADIFGAPYQDPDCDRLAKRLDKYSDEILTFLLHLQVPADNNHAERQIRSAVIMRKNSYGNRSKNGAYAQAVLMSIFRTCNLQKINPVSFLVDSIASLTRTGMPKLLPFSASSGQGG
jgi:transposase